MTTHDLKCWTISFQALRNRTKKFEFRKNDRDYNVGDILHQREWNPDTDYTGEIDDYVVTWILKEGFGLPEGYCIMSTDPCPLRVGTMKEPFPPPGCPCHKYADCQECIDAHVDAQLRRKREIFDIEIKHYRNVSAELVGGVCILALIIGGIVYSPVCYFIAMLFAWGVVES
jgi:hypothetical protein